MSFASLAFLLFLPLVFAAFWAARVRSRQNLVLLGASAVFYGWWDWRFLGLIGASVVIDYTVGLLLASAAEERARKRLLALSLVGNLGLLGLFKYYGFFARSLREGLAGVGIDAPLPELDLVLPVGISFYTFQTLSYTIDIYRRRIEPTRDFIAFAAYVSFFPQLVAGPIERARDLLPQFLKQREFSSEAASDGCRQMLWGFFKKMVVADTAARVVDAAYANPGEAGPWLLIYATVLFAFQIYCDFSGYSDIAIGCARLFGMRLSRNFDYPYFARDLREFWKRWHISLTSWFRDYVYIPLGGNRCSRPRRVLNVWIIFLVSGLWHGANWTFVMWGAVHAAFFFFTRERAAHSDTPRLRDALSIITTFGVVCLAWVFFRAASIGDAFTILTILPSAFVTVPMAPPLLPALLCVVTAAIEWTQREEQHPLTLAGWRPAHRLLCYYAVAGAIIALAPSRGVSFIYFQF